jgi:amino acid transporter
MWTNLIVNLVLLSMSDYVFLLAASNVGYIIFNFLNLNAGWIHRLDRPNWERPYRAPTVLIAIGTLLSYVNMVLMGMGANVWGKGTLMSGILLALLVIPIFIWRHYLVDKGIFPKAMREDMSLDENGGDIICRAGILPYLVLLAGILIVFFSSLLVADL